MTAILRISLVVICLLISMPVYAADYYLRDCDGDSSCGTGAGTSWANPFDTSAAAETAIQTAGRSASGDTLWVADGAYGATTWNVPTNGNGRITIKKATIASHGTETGWDNAYGDGQAVFTGASTFSTQYWAIDGSSITDKSSGHGIKYVGTAGANTIAVQIGAASGNISFQKVEVTSPNVPLTYDCVRLATCTRAGFYMRDGANNITLDQVYIHDLALPLMILGNDNVIYRNSFAQRNESTTSGDPVPQAHSEFASISFGVSSNIDMYNNIFEDMEGTAIIAVMNGTDITGFNFFNNVVYYTPTASPQTGFGNGVITCTNTGTNCINFNIYNNTFANIPLSSRISYISSAESLSNWVVKNNLWWCGSSCGTVTNQVNAQISYDNNWYGGVTYTTAENGAINGGSENPFTDSSTYDFTLKASSTPIGAGSTLASVVPFTTYGTYDISGNARSEPWDIGAYKYGEAVPDTTAPTISTATINAAGDTLTLVFSEPVAINTSTGFTLTMTNGPAGLAYASGSGTATIIYSITGRLIEDGEIGSLDYVTVTNGIEDAAGNDLASTGSSDITATNDSTHVPSEPSYTVTVSVGDGCATDKATAEVVEAGTVTVTCTPSNNYTCIAWTATAGCSGGSGTTTYTSGQVTGSCTVTQPCRKISPDVAIGSGAAVTLGSGAVGTLY
jgi:hypothetical protein